MIVANEAMVNIIPTTIVILNKYFSAPLRVWNIELKLSPPPKAPLKVVPLR